MTKSPKVLVIRHGDDPPDDPPMIPRLIARHDAAQADWF